MASNIRLFVGNLPENSCENDIKVAFSSYGEIINVDIKSKSNAENEKKKFAFVTLCSSEYDVESCLKHFSNEDFHGNRLYVTRARESFLERLQREREEAGRQQEKTETPKPVQRDFGLKQNNSFEQPRNNKRKFLDEDDSINKNFKNNKVSKPKETEMCRINHYKNDELDFKTSHGDKKQESEKKRLESMRRKREEFKEKKMIIKTGLTGIDKVSNKKIIFSDNEDNNLSNNKASKKKTELFDDDGSDDDINFAIKEQFEGEKGQKVLDLQSRYKSDKRFMLDERFAEDSNDENDTNGKNDEGIENVELNQADEKSKQLNILQDLLGVSIRTKSQEPSSKVKAKLGMLRFNPLQPDHAKFLAPVEPIQDNNKKSKKKKTKANEVKDPEPVIEAEKVEVSKEQFYEVSDVLKEAITQPTAFSLRSLFTRSETNEEDLQENGTQSIPLVSKDKKVKNPLDPGEKNPFVYDSSESDDEENNQSNNEPVQQDKTKAVWRENLFFSQFDNRLKEGLEFFNKTFEGEVQKERRQLKSVMKKRLYNKERKNKMFQKKIGGRKKTVKKNYRKSS